jgi:hypothetical protein
MKQLTLIISLFLFTGCAGTVPHLHRESGIMQVQTFDNSLFGPSTKYSEYYQCDTEPVPEHDTVVVEKFGDNCTLKNSFHSSGTGIITSLSGSAMSGIAAGALIRDGLKNSNPASGVGNNTIINNACKGNCGGKK